MASEATQRLQPQRQRVDHADVLRPLRSALAVLRSIVDGGDSALGAVHALWTLDGVDFIDDGTLRSGLSFPDPRVRAAAAEIAERRLDLEGSDLIDDVLAGALADPNARARLHALLALGARCPARRACEGARGPVLFRRRLPGRAAAARDAASLVDEMQAAGELAGLEGTISLWGTEHTGVTPSGSRGPASPVSGGYN